MTFPQIDQCLIKEHKERGTFYLHLELLAAPRTILELVLLLLALLACALGPVATMPGDTPGRLWGC